MSVNLDAIERTISEGADALIVHHGLFKKNEGLTIKGYIKQRIKSILDNDINLFSYHLPLDLHPETGNSRLLLRAIEVDVIEEPSEGSKGREGGGLFGIFHKPVPVADLVKRVDCVLEVKSQHFLSGKDEVSTVYVLSGAGRNELDEALCYGVDAFITGDAKESTKYLVKEGRLNYIYAGHYATEKLGIKALGEKIEERFHVEVSFVDIPDPF